MLLRCNAGAGSGQLRGAQRVELALRNIGDAERERATDRGRGRGRNRRASDRCRWRCLGSRSGRYAPAVSGCCRWCRCRRRGPRGYQASVTILYGELECVGSAAPRSPDVVDPAVNVRLRKSEVHRQKLPRKVRAAQVTPRGDTGQRVGDYWRINIQRLEQAAGYG